MGLKRTQMVAVFMYLPSSIDFAITLFVCCGLHSHPQGLCRGCVLEAAGDGSGKCVSEAAGDGFAKRLHVMGAVGNRVKCKASK